MCSCRKMHSTISHRTEMQQNTNFFIPKTYFVRKHWCPQLVELLKLKECPKVAPTPPTSTIAKFSVSSQNFKFTQNFKFWVKTGRDWDCVGLNKNISNLRPCFMCTIVCNGMFQPDDQKKKPVFEAQGPAQRSKVGKYDVHEEYIFQPLVCNISLRPGL